jgi:hypothetical protein
MASLKINHGIAPQLYHLFQNQFAAVELDRTVTNTFNFGQLVNTGERAVFVTVGNDGFGAGFAHTLHLFFQSDDIGCIDINGFGSKTHAGKCEQASEGKNVKEFHEETSMLFREAKD